MNVIKEIERITELELSHGIFGGSTGSWHHKYKDSAWVYIGGLSYELTEGDIICFMSQWGEIEDINLVRDKATNKSMGFAFVKYGDQRSTILAVDNFNGMTLLGRTLRCDHVDKYKLPKEVREKEEEELEKNPHAEVQIGPGHAYKSKDLANQFNITAGIDLWKRPEAKSDELVKEEESNKHHHGKKHKKEKKTHKKEKHKKRKHSEDKSIIDNLTGSQAVVSDSAQDRYHVGSAAEASLDSSSNAQDRMKPSLPVADPNASWRGRMDPSVSLQAEADRKRIKLNAEGSDRRDEFNGFGGMKRRR